MKRIIIRQEKTKRGTKYYLQCNFCKKTFMILGYRFNQGLGGFCSHSCRAKKLSNFQKGNLLGKNNPAWKGGRTINNFGYVLIHKSNHPSRSSDDYVLEHHIIMEQKLGRYLKDDEIVHHINGNKSDNRIENLILTTPKEHHKKYHLETIKKNLENYNNKRKDI